MSLPVLALVGRPNVGKSTLFNALTRTRDALVADYPGLTRDRRYGRVVRSERPFLVVDTGGMVEFAEGIEQESMRQVTAALDEADVILFMVDARAGLTASDQHFADALRRLSKPVVLTANKVDGLREEVAVADFHGLGLGDPVPVAASHGAGLDELLVRVEALLPAAEADPEEIANAGIRIAVVGRPNVGKSTLVNRILGEQRVVVFDQPGTTRDSIDIPFEKDGKNYLLIDTAGLRRRARVSEMVEKFSAIKALKAIERSEVVIYLVDASEGVTDQDANLLGMVVESGRGLLIALNKWDGLTTEQREKVRRQIDVKLPFVEFAGKHFISALHGTGVGHLLEAVDAIHRSVIAEFSTSLLTRLLQEFQAAHQPPLVRGRRIRLKLAQMVGHNPPSIVIHGNQTDELPSAYRRYLTNAFREALRLESVPVRLEFKSSFNPFKGRKNELTERQIRSRRRLMRHVKKR
jgi:GTP-binding protein